jgi:CSLREA domain-containing protein
MRQVLLLLVVLATSARAATIAVTTTADGVIDDAACSLREAVRSANLNTAIGGCAAGDTARDTIMLPAGTYTLTVAGDEALGLQGDLNVSQPLTVMGAGASTTIIDGNSTDRIFATDSADLTLEQVTLQHGNPTYHGNSFESLGGAIRAINAQLTITNCVLKDNTGLQGGAIYQLGHTLQLDGTEVRSNQATSFGGGLQLQGTTTTIATSTIANNVSGSRGGGLFLAADTTDTTHTIVRSTISGNTAIRGGGIANQNHSVLVLRNVTISGNTTTNIGMGVLQSFGAAVTIQNSTIADNHGPGTGLQVDSGEAVTVQNSIIADNGVLGGEGADCGGTVISNGYNLVETPNSCVFNGPGDQTGVDPMLGALALNGGSTATQEPQAQSLAINRGNPASPGSNGAACEPLDQQGGTRPIASVCDVGAVETTNPGPPTTSTTTSTSTTTTSTTTSSSTIMTTTTTGMTATTTTGASTTTTTAAPFACGALDDVVVRVKRYAAPAGNEQLIVHATLPLPAGLPATLDPATTGLQLRVDDLGAGAPLLDLTGPLQIPAGARGGVACGTKDGWKKLAYQNKSGAVAPPACPAGSAAGLRSAKLTDRRKKSKGIRLVVRVPTTSLASPVGPLGVTIILGGQAAALEGACGTGAFVSAACKPTGKTWICR